MKLAGTVALVSGGASGLGLATTRELAASGAHVVVVDLGTEIPDDGTLGSSMTLVTGDVRSEADIARAVSVAESRGELRTVVTCAGIAPAGRVVGRNGPLPLADFERALSVNLLGTFNVVRLCAASMQHNKPVDGERGVVIMTASVAAIDGQVGQAAYAASKGGVAAMTLPIARELAALLIRVNTIAPGVFETPMTDAFSETVRDSLASQVPHPSRLGRPSEFATLARHITENAYLNGETIRLDGAIRMGPE
jgi:NAD(P)-dependent dehydrogenase (short-subunit alcohol dehydrogenase family)